MPFKFRPDAARTAGATHERRRAVQALRNNGMDTAADARIADETAEDIARVRAMSDAQIRHWLDEVGGEFSARPGVQAAFNAERSARGLL
jgi:uncharacterized membrane protein